MQNKATILNFVLAIVILILSVHLVTSKSNINQPYNQEEAVLNNIATRTSIRDYTRQTVEKDKIDKMLQAAMAAPTAMNRQPWHFVVVDQRSLLDQLAEANPHAKMLKKAPLAIVVCGETSGFKMLLPPLKTCCWLHMQWAWEPYGQGYILLKTAAKR